MFNSNKIAGAKDAAKAYINQMRPQNQAGLISFNTEVKLVQPVTTDKAALTQAIDSLKPDGDTAMFDALAQGVETLTSITGRKTIVLLSDGLDNRSQSAVNDVIEAIDPAGLSISTIGLGATQPARAIAAWTNLRCRNCRNAPAAYTGLPADRMPCWRSTNRAAACSRV